MLRLLLLSLALLLQIPRASGSPTCGPGASLTLVDYDHGKKNYVLVSRTSEELKQELQINGDTLENDWFKIVNFEIIGDPKDRVLRNEALSYTDCDGRNVLYHLMKARRYFADLNPSNQALQRKVIVRINVDRRYNYINHFGLLPGYNQAGHYPADPEGRWNQEIWFYKANTIVEFNWKNMLRETAIGTGAKAVVPMIIGTAIKWGSLGTGALWSLPGTFLRNFRRTPGANFAKAPYAIYNEGFHWATDDESLFTSAEGYGSPLADAFSNFFAAAILGKPVLDGPELSRFLRRKIDKVETVKPWTEKQRQNFDEAVKYRLEYYRSPFIPAILWQAKVGIDKECGQGEGDRAIWTTMTMLENHSLFTDVPPALLESIPTCAPITRARSNALFEYYKQSFFELNNRHMDFYGEKAVQEALWKN